MPCIGRCEAGPADSHIYQSHLLLRWLDAETAHVIDYYASY